MDDIRFVPEQNLQLARKVIENHGRTYNGSNASQVVVKQIDQAMNHQMQYC